MPFLTIIASNGVPARIDWPTMRCCQATTLPLRVEPGLDARGNTSAGSSRPRMSSSRVQTSLTGAAPFDRLGDRRGFEHVIGVRDSRGGRSCRRRRAC